MRHTIILAAFGVLLAVPAAAETLFVRAGAPGGDGRSWSGAYGSLSAALSAARGGDRIWVAAGTYKPEGGGRNATFRLVEGIAVIGGFAGDERDEAQRNPRRNATVLSGDIGTPDDPSDNAYHVVTAAKNAVLDSVVVTGGNADGRHNDGYGGGIIAMGGAATVLANSVISGNRAKGGGGIYVSDRTPMIIQGSAVRDNRAEFGGGVLVRDRSHAELTNVLIERNHARFYGGGMMIDFGASPVLERVEFRDNHSGGDGGGLYIDDMARQSEGTGPKLGNCRFSGNSADQRGGGMSARNRSRPTLSDCLFEDNSAGTGGGAIMVSVKSRVTGRGLVFAGNRSGRGRHDVQTDNTSKFQK